MISYALSMIPPWREALAQALDVVAPGGALHIVDFGDCAGLPAPFRAGLRRWLAAFDVTPRDDLGETLAALAAAARPPRPRKAGAAAMRRWPSLATPGDGSSHVAPESLHWVLAELGGPSDNIPRGRTIPMGAVPALARGLWAHGAHLLT